jgi:nucleosome assembly protein 1-like 1
LVEVKEEGKEPKTEAPAEAKSTEPVKGVPEFWLLALKHHDDFASMITEKDEECLKHLIDIRVADVPESAVRKRS